MSTIAPNCPVCGMTLKATGVNPDMYYCTKRKVWISDLGIHLDIVDSTIYVEPDGRQTLKIIEVPPYTFTITNEEKSQKTVVRKMIPKCSYPWIKELARPMDKVTILTVNAVLELPWNDKKKVYEKVKLYLLFS